jgi:hypothetical protein
MAKSSTSLKKKVSYNRAVGTTVWGLPPQMINQSEKESSSWQESCMDYFDYQASAQIHDKTNDLRKYRVLSGDFSLKDYSFIKDPLAMLKINNPNDKEMGGVSGSGYNAYENIIHYPIMVRPINTIIGEYIKRITQLHGFYAKNESHYARNEYNRVKTEMMQNYAENKIMAAVMKKVKAMGIKEGTEEYGQAVQQQTPEEIQEFMDRDYTDVAEKVNQTVLKNIWKTESLDSEFVEGFKHACISSKQFYHIYNVANQTKVKNLSPLDVFYQKSPSNKWVSEGQFAGFRWMLTPSSIIDMFYDKLTVTDIEEIEAMINPMLISKKKQKGITSGGIAYDTQTYSDAYGNINEHNMRSTFDMINDYQRYGESSNYSVNYGLIKVVRAYWQSYRKIGWLTSYDQNDKPIVEMVDDNYTADTDKGEFVSFTPCNQVYTGAKIGNNIYLDIGPYQDQIIDLDNLMYHPLPIEGCIMNDTHTKPYSLIDLMLPWNELYNIVAYELREDMNSSMGRVLFMSVDHIPNIPGFTMEKWHYWARKFKIAWVKQPKAGSGAANTFNQFSSADMSFAQQMTAKMEALEQIQQKCDNIAGFSAGRVAGQTTEQTLGQSNQQLSASVNQTEYLFFRHSKLIERVLNQTLNLAKKGLRKNTFMRNLFDDYELAYIDFDPEVVLNQRVGIYVTNSSEDLRKREMLETLMQPAMQNGADFADLSDMIMAETITEVKQIANKLRRTAKERAQLEQDFKNRELQQRTDHEEQIRQDLLTIEREKMASNEEVAYIKTFGGVNNSNTQDTDADGVPDILEFANFDLKQQDLYAKHMIKLRDQNFKEKQHADNVSLEKQKLKQESRRTDVMASKKKAT